MQNPNQPKISLLDLSLAELTGYLGAKGLSVYHAKQILRRVYMEQADGFDAMADLGCAVCRELAAGFVLERLPLARERVSADGSRKFLFTLPDGEQVESVLIPEKNRYTLCVSSQAGCARNCMFCLTGKGGFRRNLTPGEIVAQVRDIAHMARNASKPLTNIVFMGMGEPLDNYANLLKAITALTDNEWGMRFAARRITVSTAGVAPLIYDLGRDAGVKLAISLNAADDKTRDALMPINKEYPLAQLLQACREYPLTKGRRIAFEYILMRGVNDSDAGAAKLAKLLRGIKCKINLIPFNEHAGVGFKRPSDAAVRAFADLMCDKYKYTAIVRYSKGQDISAACGQLACSCTP